MKRLATAQIIAFACLIFGSTSVAAQPVNMKKALDRKYDILQQQADTEKLRAETEAAQARARTQTAPAPAQRGGVYTNLPTNDPLAGSDATKCETANGGGIRVSGTFRPSASAKCE